MKSILRQFIQTIATPLLAISLITAGAYAADSQTSSGILLAKITIDNPISPAMTADLDVDKPAAQPSSSRLNKANPTVQGAMAVQHRHTPEMLATAGVIGTAIGQAENGDVALLVLTETANDASRLPERIEDVPVVKLVTGKILHMKQIAAMKKPAPAPVIDPTDRFARPVPIGVSTGNAGECSAGTIGARVRKGSEVYALSNNHVYARENGAAIDSQVLQPGLYDTSCGYFSENVIGSLSAFKPIIFSIRANNVIDAAIALSGTNDLGKATPSNGYGTPKSVTKAATLGDKVQKYGRTTSLTKGSITGINVTINVGYTGGTARFVDQILVTSRKAFIKAGDSGSLLVTDPDRNPVGLLFAGDNTGRYAFANRIDPVLQEFGVSIDGE